jgi:Inosine-uridine preferring nucleoside hydrolase
MGPKEYCHRAIKEITAGFLPPIIRRALRACVCEAQSNYRSDARGPATTDQQSILVFLQSPDVETLGITIVSGDMWRDDEVAHTLRMLEIVGPSDIPVVPGAVYPLINREESILRWEKLYGTVSYKGA